MVTGPSNTAGPLEVKVPLVVRLLMTGVSVTTQETTRSPLSLTVSMLMDYITWFGAGMAVVTAGSSTVHST